MKVHYCNQAKWVSALGNPAFDLDLIVCRYHHRKGKFKGSNYVLEHHLLSFVEQGVLSAKIDGRVAQVTAGAIIWIPPGVACHYFGEDEAPRTRQYNLRFCLCGSGQSLSPQRGSLLLRNAWSVQPLLQGLHDHYQHGHKYAEARLRALLVLLCTTIIGLRQNSGVGARILTPAACLRLDQYVVDHVHQGVTPEQMAAVVNLSHDYFTRIFRATYGMAPREYLKRERARMAAIRLRETDLTVAEVAYELGVENISLFCRQFRAVMGCTPTEYRRRELPEVVL